MIYVVIVGLVIASGCGGSTAPPPEPPVSNTRSAVATPPPATGEEDIASEEQLGSFDDPPPPALDCFDVVPKDVTRWDPPITDDTPDGFGNKLRQLRLVDLCERGWERLAIECFGKPSTNVTTCIGMLSPERRVENASTIAEVNELHRKVLSGIKTPASYTCDKVAIAHYTDAKWKAELPTQTGVERTRSITKARKRLVEECKTALWSEGTRACLTTVTTSTPCGRWNPALPSRKSRST